jgi:hypothetical protein
MARVDPTVAHLLPLMLALARLAASQDLERSKARMADTDT